jgi:L-lactate dehydrogenase complex protein LldG
MNSREKILAEIRKNKPASLPLPESFSVVAESETMLDNFTAVLQSIGGTVIQTHSRNQVDAVLKQKKESGEEVVNGVEGLPFYNLQDYVDKDRTEVENVHTVFLKGSIAVAENGAIWVSEKSMGNRLLPFICQDLVLVIEEENLVANMHQAYKRITVDEDGFGVFIAGPSKTADIEQSLVIGAHGPLSLQVFITKTAPSGKTEYAHDELHVPG